MGDIWEGYFLMSEVLIGLGGNVGDVCSVFDEAIEWMGLYVFGICRSRTIRTKPVYDKPGCVVPVVADPDYWNAVVRGRTGHSPRALLGYLQGIECLLGRVPGGNCERRPIDLDILMVDDVVLTTCALVLPHPRLHTRLFVLELVSEIAGDWVHPIFGLTLGELYLRSVSLA